MDPISMTLGLLAARLIARAEDQAVDATLAEGETALRRLRDSVRARFSREGDTVALNTLELVERTPDSEPQIGELARAIDRQAADERFRTELEELVEQAQASGVTVKRISQVAQGDGNVQVADSSATVIKIDR